MEHMETMELHIAILFSPICGPMSKSGQRLLAGGSHRTYGKNQSRCEKAKKLGILPSILWVLLTAYIFVLL